MYISGRINYLAAKFRKGKQKLQSVTDKIPCVVYPFSRPPYFSAFPLPIALIMKPVITRAEPIQVCMPGYCLFQIQLISTMHIGSPYFITCTADAAWNAKPKFCVIVPSKCHMATTIIKYLVKSFICLRNVNSHVHLYEELELGIPHPIIAADKEAVAVCHRVNWTYADTSAHLPFGELSMDSAILIACADTAARPYQHNRKNSSTTASCATDTEWVRGRKVAFIVKEQCCN